MSGQLSLDLTPAAPNPNVDILNDDGTPKRLLWCTDTARLGGPCPYKGSKGPVRPAGGCCKDIHAALVAAGPEPEIRFPSKRTQLAELPGESFEDIFGGAA